MSMNLNDPVTRLAVVVALGLIAIATVVGGIILSATDHSLPDAIVAIGSAAGGALAMASSQSRSRS